MPGEEGLPMPSDKRLLVKTTLATIAVLAVALGVVAVSAELLQFLAVRSHEQADSGPPAAAWAFNAHK
jgi:hypothetical protein